MLVISHGNTLRALVKHLDSIPDDQITDLDIVVGVTAGPRPARCRPATACRS